jgi:hypothetical protein
MATYQPTWSDLARLIGYMWSITGRYVISKSDVVALMVRLFYNQKSLIRATSYSYTIIDNRMGTSQESREVYPGYQFDALNELARGVALEGIVERVWGEMSKISSRSITSDTLELPELTNKEYDRHAELSGPSEGLGYAIYKLVQAHSSKAPR